MISALVFVSWIPAAAAARQADGGYTPDRVTQEYITSLWFFPVRVAQARTMMPESLIVVRGKIVQRVEHDRYILEDDTSSIFVTISKDRWGDQCVTASDTVELFGRLVRGLDSVWIQVKQIVRVQE